MIDWLWIIAIAALLVLLIVAIVLIVRHIRGMPTKVIKPYQRLLPKPFRLPTLDPTVAYFLNRLIMSEAYNKALPKSRPGSLANDTLHSHLIANEQELSFAINPLNLPPQPLNDWPRPRTRLIRCKEQHDSPVQIAWQMFSLTFDDTVEQQDDIHIQQIAECYWLKQQITPNNGLSDTIAYALTLAIALDTLPGNITVTIAEAANELHEGDAQWLQKIGSQLIAQHRMHHGGRTKTLCTLLGIKESTDEVTPDDLSSSDWDKLGQYCSLIGAEAQAFEATLKKGTQQNQALQADIDKVHAWVEAQTWEPPQHAYRFTWNTQNNQWDVYIHQSFNKPIRCNLQQARVWARRYSNNSTEQQFLTKLTQFERCHIPAVMVSDMMEIIETFYAHQSLDYAKSNKALRDFVAIPPHLRNAIQYDKQRGWACMGIPSSYIQSEYDTALQYLRARWSRVMTTCQPIITDELAPKDLKTLHQSTGYNPTLDSILNQVKQYLCLPNLDNFIIYQALIEAIDALWQPINEHLSANTNSWPYTLTFTPSNVWCITIKGIEGETDPLVVNIPSLDQAQKTMDEALRKIQIKQKKQTGPTLDHRKIHPCKAHICELINLWKPYHSHTFGDDRVSHTQTISGDAAAGP